MKWKRTNKSAHLYLHGHAVEISWHWRSRGGSVSNGVGACFTEMNFRCGYAQTPRCYLQKNELYVRETQSQAQKLNLQDALCEAYLKALWSLYQSTSFILMPTWSFLPGEPLSKKFSGRSLKIVNQKLFTSAWKSYPLQRRHSLKSPTHLHHFSV